MGTSSSFGGPSGRTPLLPPWAQDGEPPPDPTVPANPDPLPDPDAPPREPQDGGEGDDGTPLPVAPAVPPQPPTPAAPAGLPTVSWAAAKRGVTAYTSSQGDRGGLRNAASRYVGARGGSRTAARAAQAGRAATARVGGFLSGVAARGFADAARALGLTAHLGQGVERVLAAIANALAPDGATQEEAVARQAVNETLAYLYERYGLADGDLTKLDAMDRAGVAEAVGVSVAAYIYHRWVQELGRRIEENAFSAQEAVRLERDVRAFIAETVQFDLTRVDAVSLDWGGPAGQRFVEQIYADAYAMLEVE